MPSYNRARKFGGGGGALGALLAGIGEYFAESGVVPNEEIQGPTPQGPPIAASQDKFRATNWLARPNARNLNNQYLLDVAASERQTEGGKQLETHRTNEQFRGRQLALPILEQEEYNRGLGTNRANLKVDTEREPLRRGQKIFDESVGVVSRDGMIPSETNISRHDETLTEPILTRRLQNETTRTAQDMLAQDRAGIEARAAQRLEGPNLDNALLKAQLEGLQMEADKSVLPIETEARKKIAPYRPEALRREIINRGVQPLSPGTIAYDVDTGQPRFSNPRDTGIAGFMNSDGSYPSQTSADSAPDQVTNTPVPQAGATGNGMGDLVIDKNTNELVNIRTGKRIPLKDLQ